MRTLFTALCLVFAIGGFVVAPAQAGCEAHRDKVKSDFETPPPVTAPIQQDGT
jgi:hypothetical protein